MKYLGDPEVVEEGPSGRISVQKCALTGQDGIALTGQQWRASPSESAAATTDPIRILCLHGFLDNCRSFAALAPGLLRGLLPAAVDLVALDFPGHGQSSHKSMDHPPYMVISDIVYYVASMTKKLQWDRFWLMGHSMGGMASIMYAGTFPEQIQQLILLDGFGPDFERPNRMVNRLRQHVQQRYDGNMDQVKKKKRLYKTLDVAIQTRQQTATKSPGDQWLSATAAQEMVEWAIVSAPNGDGWNFRHDPRLYWPALQAHTLEQAYDFWKSIRDEHVSTLWLRAKDGWPFHTKWLDRAEFFLGELGTIRTLPGSHHFHADPETVDAVAQAILETVALLPPKS